MVSRKLNSALFSKTHSGTASFKTLHFSNKICHDFRLVMELLTYQPFAKKVLGVRL